MGLHYSVYLLNAFDTYSLNTGDQLSEKLLRKFSFDIV